MYKLKWVGLFEVIGHKKRQAFHQISNVGIIKGQYSSLETRDLTGYIQCCFGIWLNYLGQSIKVKHSLFSVLSLSPLQLHEHQGQLKFVNIFIRNSRRIPVVTCLDSHLPISSTMGGKNAYKGIFYRRRCERVVNNNCPPPIARSPSLSLPTFSFPFIFFSFTPLLSLSLPLLYFFLLIVFSICLSPPIHWSLYLYLSRCVPVSLSLFLSFCLSLCLSLPLACVSFCLYVHHVACSLPLTIIVMMMIDNSLSFPTKH